MKDYQKKLNAAWKKYIERVYAIANEARTEIEPTLIQNEVGLYSGVGTWHTTKKLPEDIYKIVNITIKGMSNDIGSLLGDINIGDK